jgi:hypothetical protein
MKKLDGDGGGGNLPGANYQYIRALEFWCFSILQKSGVWSHVFL